MAQVRIWRSPAALLRWASVAVVAFHVLAFGLWSPGSDARIYYDVELETFGRGEIFGTTFTYSPAAAWWLQPLQAPPFEAFRTLVAAVNMAGFVFLIGPVFAAIILLAQLLPVWMEFQQGNINFALGAVLVLGFRRAGLYAFPLLTKVTPGIGLAWFAFRREWRPLVITGVITMLVAAPSLVLHASAWPVWIESLMANAGADAQIGAPIVLRAALALALVGWGALTDRPWTVPIAAALVAHVNSSGWLIGLAALPLYLDRHRAGTQGELVAST